MTTTTITTGTGTGIGIGELAYEGKGKRQVVAYAADYIFYGM